MCWQSYGLIAPFRSFDMNDVYVFGTEVFSAIEDDQTFMAAVHRDPLPFFMLMVGQESPHLMSGEHELRHCVAEQDLPPMDPSPRARLRGGMESGGVLDPTGRLEGGTSLRLGLLGRGKPGASPVRHDAAWLRCADGEIDRGWGAGAAGGGLYLERVHVGDFVPNLETQAENP